MNNIFYEDFKYRGQNIYEQYMCIIRDVFKRDSKLIKSELKINIIENMNLGGSAWHSDNVDNIQINTGLIDNFFDYFCNLNKKRDEILLDTIMHKSSKIDIDDFSYEKIKYDNNRNYR